MSIAIYIALVVLTIFSAINFVMTLALSRRIRVISAGAAAVSSPMLSPGEAAPAFVAERLNGEIVTLDTYRGKSVGLIFISPSCKPCTDAMPVYQEASADAHNKGIELVLVSVGSHSDTREYVAKVGITLSVICAPRSSNTFFHDYRVPGTPSYVLINADGTLDTIGYPMIENGKLLL